ncbi:MAG TPA: isoamylase early set domain-containing protein, partial [Gemmatimonadaceae bacterium]|nr:isoamylase early set domain-containing protein [Gemmatimonadaceae bacterium]
AGRPGVLARAWRWLVEPRPITISPVLAVAAVAGLVFLAVLGGERDRAATTPRHERVAAAAPVRAGEVRQAGGGADDRQVVHFVFIAPSASSVAIVGDFNDWSVTATPMHRAAEGGAWSVAIPLRPGRYSYSFIVDGREWKADPLAPPAPHDDFGKPNSAVTVAGRAT